MLDSKRSNALCLGFYRVVASSNEASTINMLSEKSSKI